MSRAARVARLTGPTIEVTSDAARLAELRAAVYAFLTADTRATSATRAILHRAVRCEHIWGGELKPLDPDETATAEPYEPDPSLRIYVKCVRCGTPRVPAQ